jgi:hypothetical protein
LEWGLSSRGLVLGRGVLVFLRGREMGFLGNTILTFLAG